MHRFATGRFAARLLRRAIWIAAVAVVACVPPSGGPRPTTSTDIGVLATAGPLVYVNGALARPGATIRNRDTVSTGAASSALVNFTTGGSLQLNANTDPSLSQFVAAARCVIEIVAGGGELYADTDPCDCVFRTPETESSCGSKFAARIGGGRTTILLISGHMSVRRPVATELKPFEQVVMTRNGIVDRRVLSKSEVRDAISWRGRFKYDYGDKRQGQQGIEVPPLVKQPVRNAMALTRKLGLKLQVVANQGIAGDTQIIVDQQPPPGTIVAPGAVVTVWTQGVIQ